MKVFRASTEHSHYLIVAESIEHAYPMARDESISYVQYESVFEVDHVSTDMTEPCILEIFV